MKKSSIIFVCVCLMALFVYTGSAFADNGIFNSFNSRYPGSSSGSASCQLCHGSSTSTLNEYGLDLQLSNLNFSSVESDLSVNINGGTTYLDEINAGTQPGWTTGANNNLYNRNDGSFNSTVAAPNNVGALDPAAPQPTPPTCGDGIVNQNSEDCDDGNNSNLDNCLNDCTLPACGDGFANGNEQCDDGNNINEDDCLNDCTLPNANQPVSECGNGVTEQGEECDDGNNSNGDGCENDCTVTQDEQPAPPPPAGGEEVDEDDDDDERDRRRPRRRDRRESDSDSD